MKNTIIKYKLELTGSVAGAIAGWVYWYLIGCSSGTCAISSSAVNSSLYGAFMGFLIFGLFKKENTNNKKEEHEFRKSD